MILTSQLSSSPVEPRSNGSKGQPSPDHQIAQVCILPHSGLGTELCYPWKEI